LAQVILARGFLAQILLSVAYLELQQSFTQSRHEAPS